jgi:hypothetical protein
MEIGVWMMPRLSYAPLDRSATATTTLVPPSIGWTLVPPIAKKPTLVPPIAKKKTLIPPINKKRH